MRLYYEIDTDMSEVLVHDIVFETHSGKEVMLSAIEPESSLNGDQPGRWKGVTYEDREITDISYLKNLIENAVVTNTLITSADETGYVKFKGLEFVGMDGRYELPENTLEEKVLFE